MVRVNRQKVSTTIDINLYKGELNTMYFEDKAKELLGINKEVEIEIEKLYDKLYEYRNKWHPDKNFKELEKIATEKFTQANDILIKLKDEMIQKAELESIGKNAIEIYGKYTEKRQEKFEIVELQNKIDNLKTENKTLESKLMKYIDIEKKAYNNENNEKQKLILKKISIKRRDVVIFGGAVSVTALALIIQQFNFYKTFIVKESYINSSAIKLVTTGIITLTLFWILLKLYLQKKYIEIINLIDTTSFRINLNNYCKANSLQLSESNISTYINNSIINDKLFLFLCERILFIKKECLVDLIKEQFIYSSIKMRFIKYSSTSNGEHTFEFISNYNTDDDLSLY